MLKFEIGSRHLNGDDWYMFAFLQADSIAELVKMREKSCNSHGNIIYQVDYSKCKRLTETYGPTRITTMMPLVVDTIGPYYDQVIETGPPPDRKLWSGC